MRMTSDASSSSSFIPTHDPSPAQSICLSKLWITLHSKRPHVSQTIIGPMPLLQTLSKDPSTRTPCICHRCSLQIHSSPAYPCTTHTYTHIHTLCISSTSSSHLNTRECRLLHVDKIPCVSYNFLFNKQCMYVAHLSS